MRQISNPVSRQKDVVVQELKGELLIYDLLVNKVYCLNETSALVYQLCDGNNSVAEISRGLSGKLKQLVTEDFVWLALAELKKRNLLENSRKIEIGFEKFSRREAIRRAGLAATVALPIVLSLTAPRAVNAQSDVCTADSCTCSVSNLNKVASFCAATLGGTPTGCNTLVAGCDCLVDPLVDTGTCQIAIT